MIQQKALPAISLYQFLKNIDAAGGIGDEISDLACAVMMDEKAPKNSNSRLIDHLLHRRDVPGGIMERVLNAWKAARVVAR